MSLTFLRVEFGRTLVKEEEMRVLSSSDSETGGEDPFPPRPRCPTTPLEGDLCDRRGHGRPNSEECFQRVSLHASWVPERTLWNLKIPDGELCPLSSLWKRSAVLAL